MKTTYQPIAFCLSLLLMGSAFCLTSCSDDDDPVPPVEEITTQTLYGDYAGTLNTLAASTHEEGEEEADKGVAIEVKADKDTLYIDDFPIKDIVRSLVNDETAADQIVAAVGKVSYKMGYKPELSAEKDSIYIELDPKPLLLQVALGGEEGTELPIEVKVASATKGAYAVEGGKLTFRFSADEVLLGTGDEQTALPGFQPLTFDFDLTKKN